MRLTKERLLEIFPGLLTWCALLAPFILSLYIPATVVFLVLMFDLYWLVQSLTLAVNAVRVFRKIVKAKKINWVNKIEELNIPLDRLKKLKMAIIMVHYKESYELVAKSIESFIKSDFSLDKLIFIFASEKRNEQEARKIFGKLKMEFGANFGEFIQTIHPDGLTGEIAGKSANETWAGRFLKKYCDDHGINYSDVILNNFDADTRVYPNYFSHLAYTYLTTFKAEDCAYQPVHIYENNIWDTHAVMRVVAMSASLIYMSNTMRSLKFHNFSSRSDSFQNVVNVGFWDPDVIPEDQRQYFNSFFFYEGKNRVIPLYVPLRMDAVYAGGLKVNLVMQYKQLRRWAWGVSDFPYIVRRSFEDKKISWRVKLAHLASFIEGHFMWAIAPFYVSLMGWVPIVVNRQFKFTVIAANFPYYSRYMLSFALVGLGSMIVLSFLLLPPRPKHHSPYKYIFFLLQWILAPLVSIFITAVAAIDAQTRLMLGKRLDYQVTEKKVAKG